MRSKFEDGSHVITARDTCLEEGPCKNASLPPKKEKENAPARNRTQVGMPDYFSVKDVTTTPPESHLQGSLKTDFMHLYTLQCITEHDI